MLDVIDWPDALTIPMDTRELKGKMLALLRGEEDEVERERELNYVVAVSSGKAVTEEIPKQIGRRAGWASQQGANFVELAIENPAQLIMDQDMLLNLANTLNLHYNIHSSTSMAYGMAYRQAQGQGYDPVHEYTAKLLVEIDRFREQLRAHGLDPAEDGLPRLYSINPHMAVSPMPAEEDRLAQDVSVDPFGHELRYSHIFRNTETRLGIWKYYFWEYLNMKDDPDSFAQLLNVIETIDDQGDYIRYSLIDILEREGYISDEVLEFVRELVRNQQLAQSYFNLSAMNLSDLPDSLDELKNHQNGSNYAYQLAQFDPERGWERIEYDLEEGRYSDHVEQRARQMVQEELDEEELRQMSPDEIERRAEGKMPEAKQEILEEQILQAADLDLPEDIPDKDVLDLTTRDFREMQEEANYAILDRDGEAFQDVTEFFGSDDDEFEEEHRKPSEVMRRLAGSRRLFQQEFNKESTIFRRLMPLWLPFAGDQDDQYAALEDMWEGITGEPFADHEEAIEWLFDPQNEGENAAMNDPRKEEDVIAASTGAYVWGHFTQIPPGYSKTFVQRLEEVEMFMTFESHFVGPAEQTRIWKPKDQAEVAKAINNTPVPIMNEENGNWVETERRTTDRCRITIDMEHLASQKVDPLWVVNPDEEGEDRGYKGLDDGDGKYILMQHVTHPYITESGAGHEHGPIQRGDTLVYRYIYELIDRGMATNEDYPAVFMYELGAEKTETMFLLRLILRMIEYGIHPDELTNEGGVTDILNRDHPKNIKEYLIQKYFGVTDTEVQHEWQEIFEHAMDPLDDLMEMTEGSHTWMGRAATEGGTRPEDWEKEKYR